jgi:hypothetical protein
VAPLSKKQLRGSLPYDEQERLSIRAGYNRQATLATAKDLVERGLDHIAQKKVITTRRRPALPARSANQPDTQFAVALAALDLSGDLRR